MIGKRLGDYEVLREIGEGGQGEIYLARNVHLADVQVVLKILKSKGEKKRFLREANTLAKLDHRNICQMKHFFTHENDLILVVQFIDGTTLKDLITSGEEIDLQEIQNIFLQVLDALIYAHRHGVTHRDIKPSNIMITTKRQVKIIDFGISRDLADPRLTRTGTSAGTPQYMAPEQFTEEKIEDFTSCDIYSAGISL
ncbi:MAG: serine/threonine-protein kinase, partial [bacterium]